MIGIHETKQHNWRCDFCSHTSWKTQTGALNHAEREHPKDLRIQRLAYDLERERNKAPKIEVREKVVYRDAPKPKYWYRTVYCSTCKIVLTGAGIPREQTIENTPHSDCGNRTLMLVTEIR